MPLTFRFMPPIGGILYWLRPGTVRLPPWPDRVPLTRGTRRTLVDVAALRGRARVAASTCCSPTASRRPGPPPGASTRRLSPCCSGFLGLLGLRDKVSFLAARPGGLRAAADRLPVPARQPDRRRAARLPLHLVGRGRVEAQPPLPVRGLGDDQQHALEPLAQGEGAALPRPPGGPAPSATGGARRPPRHGDRVHPAAGPAPLAAAARSARSRWSGWSSSTSTSSRRSRSRCRWSGTSS